jgi:adenine-specific DNA-methyltransferase
MNKSNTTSTSTQELGQSPDALAQRHAELLALIRQTVPEVMADNQIDVEKLKELLGQDHIASDEHYELSWAGKAAARREIQKTSSLTLLPDANNPPNAQHMLIEGENLEVLRVLQKSYYGKVKMIYIDPPYNTGNDSFVYPDDYSETLEAYQKRTGEKNEAGYLNKQSLWKKNSKESGQYHSAWLTMMYPRLYLARNLLRDDGVIAISIDDNEVANLNLLLSEVFGGENFVAQLPTIMNLKGNNDEYAFAGTHEYTLVYCKDRSKTRFQEFSLNEEELEAWEEDEHGPFKKGANLKSTGGNAPREKRPNLFFPLYISKEGVVRVERQSLDDEEVLPITEGKEMSWRWEREKFKNEPHNLIVSKEGVNSIYKKQRPSIGDIPSKKPKTIFYKPEYSSGNGTAQIKEIFGEKFFSNPKPVQLIKDLLEISTQKDSLILDFFAGSGTTAHAAMELNIQDGGDRKFICVQMPETLDENNDAFNAGYRTIADITRSRIDKVIVKLKGEHPDKTQDLACANFTLSPSNFKVWRGDVNDTEALREQLAMFQSAEKAGQSKQADTQTAMLTELLLKHGLGALGVHAIAKPRQVAGATVHRVLLADDKTMWLCFETYTNALKDEIVKAMPAQVVMLNSCFVGTKADEQLANLQLELTGLDIGLTVI